MNGIFLIIHCGIWSVNLLSITTFSFVAKYKQWGWYRKHKISILSNQESIWHQNHRRKVTICITLKSFPTPKSVLIFHSSIIWKSLQCQKCSKFQAAKFHTHWQHCQHRPSLLRCVSVIHSTPSHTLNGLQECDFQQL